MQRTNQFKISTFIAFLFGYAKHPELVSIPIERPVLHGSKPPIFYKPDDTLRR